MLQLDEKRNMDISAKHNSAHLLVMGEVKAECGELSAGLRRFDFAVDVAVSCEEGIEKAVSRRPELILFITESTSLQGKVLNGIQELSELEVTHEIPVMLISSSTDPEYCVDALRTGVADCLSKPINYAELQLRINKLLVTRRQQSKLQHKLRLYEQRYGPMSASCKELETKDTVRTELERVHKARRILCDDLVDPPSLNDLASMLGTNQPRLSRNFRSVFGTTVFGFLREQRLQRARELLIETSMPIKAVALEIGYRNTSDLTRGIKERFGMPPTELREQLRVTSSVTSLRNAGSDLPRMSVAI